jgi:hypothetical protein
MEQTILRVPDNRRATATFPLLVHVGIEKLNSAQALLRLD